MSKLQWTGLMVTLSLLYPGPVYPQSSEDSSLDLFALFEEEMMVVAASRFMQKVREAPSSISIVTRDEIQQFGYRTLADILNGIRGFYVGNDRNYDYLGVRGFNRPGDYNSRILILIDGQHVNDNVYNQANIGTGFLIDVDLIDRVEVVRGPSASIYGNGAFFAVVNVVTKSGSQLTGVEVSGEAGSFEAYKGRVSYGNRWARGWDLLVSLSLYDHKGKSRLFFEEFDDPSTNDGFAENLDGDYFKSLFGKIVYQGFSIEGAYNRREKDIPTASFDTVFNQEGTKTIDEQIHVDTSYQHRFSKLFDGVIRFSYGLYDYDGDYLYEGSSDQPWILVTNKDEGRGDWWGGELKLSTRLFHGHHTIIGGEYQDNFRQDQHNYDEAPFVSYLDDERQSKNWAVYLQDEFSILDTTILNAGVRLDHYDTFGGTINPRAALIHHPWIKTTVKLLYGTAFRAPNFFELYFQDGDTSKSNPDLDPEKIKTYEMIIEQRFGSRLRGSVSGYFYEIDDLIAFETDPLDGLLVFNNLEEVEARGLELELSGKWEQDLRARLSYSYQDAQDRQTGKVLTNSPHHLAKGNFRMPIWDFNVYLGLDLQYASRRTTTSGRDADPFWVSNLTLTAPGLWDELDLSASVYNVFDRDYGDPASQEHRQDIIRRDGRTYRAKAIFRF